MIEIAKALACDARIIVMDEPTSALTDVEVERLFEIIRELKSARPGHRLHHAPDGGDLPARGPDHRAARRQRIGTARAAELPRDELVRWMVGRELTKQFPTAP